MKIMPNIAQQPSRRDAQRRRYRPSFLPSLSGRNALHRWICEPLQSYTFSAIKKFVPQPEQRMAAPFYPEIFAPATQS
jgi:hypothetical protein